MKKTLKTIALVLTLVMTLSLVLAGCNKDKKEKSDNKNSEKLFIVGLDASFPPYGYKDKEGNIVGFDIDLAKEVAKRNGWEFKAQPIDWNAKDFELNSGTIDCIWNGFTINGREDDYTWSEPYVINNQVVVVKKDSKVKNVKDLAGKIVTVQAGSSAESLLQNEKDEKMTAIKNSFKELQKVPDYEVAFLNLEAGSTEAIAMDIGVAKYQIEKRGADKFVMLEELLAKEEYGIGFKKGNTELRDKVQKTLDEMKEDGTLEEIAKKYEKYDIQDSIILD